MTLKFIRNVFRDCEARNTPRTQNLKPTTIQMQIIMKRFFHKSRYLRSAWFSCSASVHECVLIRFVILFKVGLELRCCQPSSVHNMYTSTLCKIDPLVFSKTWIYYAAYDASWIQSISLSFQPFHALHVCTSPLRSHSLRICTVDTQLQDMQRQWASIAYASCTSYSVYGSCKWRESVYVYESAVAWERCMWIK